MPISHQLIGQLAGVIAFISVIPYLVSILRGNTKPSRTAYAIWLIIDVISAASYIASGARSTMWVNVVVACSAAIIFCLSIKYGMGGYEKFDIVCLVLAAVAILFWVTTNNPVTALYISVAAGKIGYLPVIRKAYYAPQTESTLSWLLIVVAAALNILALTTLRPEIAIPPIVSFIFPMAVAVLLVFPPGRRRPQKLR